MIEEKDKIINSLNNENKELIARVKLLENIVDKMNDYIYDNNLGHYRFYGNDYEYIDYEEYRNLKSIVIPETRYLVLVSDKDE